MPGHSVTYTPIGVVRSPVTEMSRGHWAGVECDIRLDPVYAPGLMGLEGFSHVVVAFHLDRSGAFDTATQLTRRPRGAADAAPVGVFAQRTKYRPNAIGITTVELLGVEDNVLRVRGLDALDGTPVLDIKPYMAVFDRAPEARMPDWVGPVMADYF